jgi:hypothetical protein
VLHDVCVVKDKRQRIKTKDKEFIKKRSKLITSVERILDVCVFCWPYGLGFGVPRKEDKAFTGAGACKEQTVY